MCGIAGVFAYGQQDPNLRDEVLRRMADRIVHRGPDDAGVYVNPDRRLGFAFRRLSIIDLSAAGHQPMSNEDGSIWIVFNGEIYNHADHRAVLESRGHVYRSHTDTETILHLYEEYGEDCVQHLRGMFAFAIWDQKRERLFLARDRIGIKPLYYTQQSGKFLFGSEIKAILAYPGVSREVNTEALEHYLTFMIPPAPQTLFAGIQKLAAGHHMTIDRQGNVRTTCYWDAIVPAEQESHSDEYYAERTRELLNESIRLRMMSDVPIGVFLSGGVDSSTNVALMSQLASQPINTFSVGFRGHDAYNELQYARVIAEQYRTNHREVIIDHRDALEYLPQLIHTQDEPIADWVCVPLYFVSKLARDSGVVVVHVGEGADELFCGYPHYLRALDWQRRWGWVTRVPRSAWRRAARMAAASVGGREGFGPLKPGLRWIDSLADGGRTFWGGAIVFRGQAKRRLLNTRWWKDHQRHDSGRVPEAILSYFAGQKPTADALERMIYLELKHRLPELLLMRVDKVTMSTSLEARVPFLDHKLVEFAMGIPMEAKIRNGESKTILKRAVADLLPADIIHRRKQGFSAPVAEWFRNELSGELEHSLTQGWVGTSGLFNVDYVRELIAQHREGRWNYAVHLWNLYNLELWHRHWIDGNGNGA